MDLRGASGLLKLMLEWIKLATGQWDGEKKLVGGGRTVIAPGQGGWVAVITAAR